MLEAADLACERGGKTLFRGLSFTLEDGEFLQVAGANGSGKTSLLRILCGLLAPAHGEVRWRGSAITRLREDYAREVLYIGHAAGIKDDLTAAENLAITCTLAGIQVPRAALEAALQRLQVADSSLIRRLSQGQRRRAALARLALSRSVPLWLLDEPFAALDAQASSITEELIGEHLASGGLVVLTTHQASKITPNRVLDLGYG